MEVIHIATGHAFELLGSIAIVASLLFTAVELRHVEKAQRVTNLLTITKHHREIWQLTLERPELNRVLQSSVNLTSYPITNEEALFVTFLINHLQASFHATKAKMFVSSQALARDIQWFFSLPIPASVWKSSKMFQDHQFASFVEEACAIH